MSNSSLVNYYRENCFNPVPIDLQDRAAWELHVAKRRNLYERHLGIPLSLLRGRSVLEFGCNSGENALVLASIGANLTLVEPNVLVFPRLRELFEKFGFEQRVVALIQRDIDSFEAGALYDVIIGEGFLNTLPNRNEMMQKICGLLASGGLGVISFDDRYGHLLEITRKLILRRTCQLEGVDDVHSASSLELAGRLYSEDFAQLNASRPFEAWWKDVLVNPFVAWAYLWTYQELLPLFEKTRCEFYSSSPKWASIDCFSWYKDIVDRNSLHQRLLEEWAKVFPFFLTGLRPSNESIESASEEVVNSVSELILRASEYITGSTLSVASISYPPKLYEYFERSNDPRLLRFNEEMKSLYEATKSSNEAGDLISTYHGAKCVRDLWGAPYHYICINKLA